MLRKQWQEYALKAKQIAKNIVTGLEQNKNGVRLIQIVYGLDMYATDALNLKYSKQRSKSSVHTYQGGRQEISTQHADGSEGLFKSNGEFHSTNNPMDIEVKEYMNNSKNESKNMNKKLIRLTEQDLHRIVKESVSKILKESYIDATPYEYDVDDGDEFDKISKGFAKMPKGYDNDLDIEGDYPTIDKIAMLNKDSEAEAYPNIKKREIDASWKALKNQTPRKPIDPHFDKAFRTDNRFAAKNYTSNKR